MEKQIAHIRYKMIGVVTIIGLLSAWQHDFIEEGIRAHVQMNLTILSAFGFSIIVAFVFVSQLKNEVIAFKALREMWDDIRVAPAENRRDPLWRHYRCSVPGRVFKRPRLLGHAYDLVTDELARTQKIRVSLETMNTLVHKIEQTIADEKSLIVYMSGLMVFMGLIGTFIGLLHMVSAIGGIIGALAQSAGGAGANGAFQELLAKLQEPLKGMASGFASSLFGLFSSLVIGLLGRFAGQAAGVLKGEFESWLAGVVQIGEDEHSEHHAVAVAGPVAVAADPSALQEPALLRMVGGVLTDYAKVAGSFDHAARVLQDMRSMQDRQSGVLERVLGEIDRLNSTQVRLLEHISATAPIAPALRELSAGLESFGSSVTRRIEADVGGLRQMLQEMDRAHAAGLRGLSSNQLQITTQLAAAIDQLNADIERRMTLPAANVAPQIDQSLRAGIGEIGRLLAGHSDRLEAHVGNLVERQDRMVEEIGRLDARRGQGETAAELSRSIEGALSEGFNRVGQTVEHAFSAYSGLLHVTIASLERSGQVAAANADAARARAENPEHFIRESEELQQMLEDFRRRAAAGRAG